MNVETVKTVTEVEDIDPMQGVVVRIYSYTGGGRHEERWSGSVISPTNSDYGIKGAMHPEHDKPWWMTSGSTRAEVEDKVIDLLGRIYAERLRELNVLNRAVGDASGYVHMGMGSYERRR